MKKEQFYEILANIDENAIKEAEIKINTKPKSKNLVYAFTAIACIAIIFVIGVMFPHSNNTVNGESQQFVSMASETEIAIEQKDITIYYLNNDEIVSSSLYLPCTSEEVFNSWKTLNGIGEEVELISVKIENNGTESINSTATYNTGDRFSINVTVTKNLQNYCTNQNKDKLLESLKLTLTGYSEIKFDEYNLIFE